MFLYMFWITSVICFRGFSCSSLNVIIFMHYFYVRCVDVTSWKMFSISNLNLCNQIDLWLQSSIYVVVAFLAKDVYGNFVLCSARRSRMVARFRGSGAQSKGQEALLIPSQPCVCSRSLVCIFSLGFCLGILVFLIWLETTFHVWQTTALLWYKRVIPSTAVTDIVILLQFPHLRLHDL